MENEENLNGSGQISKLNIGCGYDKFDGFVNIDIAEEVNPDKVVNVENGLPFQDNSFEHIYSEHCLEHVRPHYWKFVLNEIARVAKNECILELRLPFDQTYKRTNADHYRTFSYKSFNQFMAGDKRNYYSDLNLIELSKKTNKFVRFFFLLFPYLKNEIYFKFKIVK